MQQQKLCNKFSKFVYIYVHIYMYINVQMRGGEFPVLCVFI